MEAGSLPTGTVTFLLTDIEGSTRLWQEHDTAMQAALARHDEILEEAIAGVGGHFLKHTGDGVFAVFARAEQAVEAAISAQIDFQAEEHEEIGPLRVRMGIHTGESLERKGDYFGPAPSRASRLTSIANGGQVLVSAAGREVLGDAGFEFLDLGEHRLRDLTRPEHVYQLQHEDLPAAFPALTSLDARPNNLPNQLTTFIGRGREVRELCDLMGEARLVTLTGVGGSGKTRLSLQVAAELAEGFTDGTWLVELAPVSDPELVTNQAAEPFGVRAMKTDRPLRGILGDYLAEREMLLLLDNCEQIVESSGELAEFLLTRCRGLKIVATSRELLGVPGEVVYRVPPMEMAGNGDGPVEETEAVRLFAERAAQVRPGFVVNSENLPTLLEITRRLDGLPLAIELAASRTNVLTPEQMLERLDRQFRLMTSGRRERGRHTTIESALDWSYDLIAPEEQSLFRQLAVFTGGWTLEAAEEICLVPGADVLNLLGRLVDQSLVDVSEGAAGNRYRLLEPVRQYALTKLAAAGEERPGRRRHAEYFQELAEASELGLRGPDQDDWVRRIEREHDNLRSAMAWSLDNDEDELVLRTAAGLAWFWWLRGYWNEAQDWFRKTSDRTTNADDVLRSRLVYKLAALDVLRARPAHVRPLLEQARPVLEERGTQHDVAWVLQRLAEADADPEVGGVLAEESLRMFRLEGDAWGEAYAQMTIGLNLWMGDPHEGFEQMKQSVGALVTLGDRWTAGWFAFNLGYYLAFVDRLEEGRQLIMNTLDLVSGTEDRWVVAHCKNRLGIIASMSGNHEEAQRLLMEALPVHRRIGDVICASRALFTLGEVMSDGGDFATARRYLKEALDGALELCNHFFVASCLRRMMWQAVAQGDTERAALLFGALDEMRPQLGRSVSMHDERRMAQAEESLIGAMGRSAFDSQKATGATMDMDGAIALAFED